MPPEKQIRKLAAILCADAAGYSRLMGQDEAGTLATLKAHFQVMNSRIAEHRGRVVAIHGDSLVAEFGSVVDTIQCALDIQKEIKARNEGVKEDSRMLFRIGINLGDVIEEEENIFGDGVNVAVCLESLAEPGGICVSRSAYDQVKNKLTVGFQSLGSHSVKSIAEPVAVYRVVPEADAFGKAIGRAWYRLKQWQKVAVAVGIAVLQVFVGVAVKKYLDPNASSPGIFSLLTETRSLPLPDKPSIAVLPFENMTGDPKQEYFADGFTEQIITSLSKISSLFVISRNSSFTYKGKAVKLKKVSRELGVRYVLEGSIQRSGERIRINAQLIDAISDKHLWAENYDRNLKDIFALQDEVILKILTALQVNLTDGEQARVWAKGTKNLDAYLRFMQGREYLVNSNRESVARARQLAEETIALDPKYADAYVLLGATHLNDVYLGTSRPKDSIAKATELMQKALAMDDSLAEARSRLGVLYSWSGRYDEGIAEAERGVELDPNSATANFQLALVLRYAGKSKEAIPVIQKVLRMTPTSPDIYVQNLALAYFQTGNCEDAIATSEKGLRRVSENLNSHVIMAAVYGYCDKEKEARKEAAEVLRINPKFTVESYTKILPYRIPSERERTAQGLRKAGLP